MADSGMIPAMQVCMDYQPAVVQRAGIGRYTRALAAGLLETKAPDDALRLFYLDFFRRGRVDLEGAETKASRILPGAILQRLWRTVGLPPFDMLSGKADVFHFTNFLRPPLRRGRSVTTIFDMSFERFPEFAEARNLRNLRRGIAATAEKSDAIITISDFSAREIAEFLPAARGKLFPIPLGISPSFAPAGADAVSAMRERLSLRNPYLLAVGTIEPRKNLHFLMDVFESMEGDSALSDMDLVICGMPGWRCDDIIERFSSSPRASKIRYMRYVPDGELEALYSGAAAFVLASRYEGFGFPPLEAMACGAPVVSSAGGSLPEVLGDGAVIVHDFDPEAWRTAIARAATDDAFRADLAKRGAAKAATYRWERTARETWKVYRGEAEAVC